MQEKNIPGDISQTRWCSWKMEGWKRSSRRSSQSRQSSLEGESWSKSVNFVYFPFFNSHSRLAKPLDAKGDEEETVEDNEEVLKNWRFLFFFWGVFWSPSQEREMADDMREADDETDDDDGVTETEDNQNEADSESWEGLSAENEEEEEPLQQEEEIVKEEEEAVKEPEIPARVPELIFQDGQWVQAGDA